MKNHPKTEKRLRLMIVSGIFNTYLSTCKKVIPEKVSDLNPISPILGRYLCVSTSSRRGGEVRDTYFVKGADRISMSEINRLKKRLTSDSENIGDLLIHPNRIVRELVQLSSELD